MPSDWEGSQEAELVLTVQSSLIRARQIQYPFSFLVLYPSVLSTKFALRTQRALATATYGAQGDLASTTPQNDCNPKPEK